MAVARTSRISLCVLAALAIVTFCGGCDQGAAAKPNDTPAAEVIRGKPIRSDAGEPAVQGASSNDALSKTAAPVQAAESSEPKAVENSNLAKAANQPTVAAANDIGRNGTIDKPAPLAKPDYSSFTRPKKLPKDDKTPVGVPEKDRPDVLRVNFDDLASFEYDPYEAAPPDLGKPDQVGPSAEPPPAPVLNEQLPPRILALNKKKIIIQGFMVPIEFKRDAVRSFLLVRNQMMCCFGAMMGMNEWILVQMDGEKKTSYVQDVPTTVMGELEVGEDFQNGMVMSIYRLRAFEVTFKGGR